MIGWLIDWLLVFNWLYRITQITEWLWLTSEIILTRRCRMFLIKKSSHKNKKLQRQIWVCFSCALRTQNQLFIRSRFVFNMFLIKEMSYSCNKILTLDSLLQHEGVTSCVIKFILNCYPCCSSSCKNLFL